MSGFFSKSREDLRYLTIKNEELNKKQLKRKRRAIMLIVGFVLVFIQIIATVLATLKLYNLNMIPEKYLVMAIVVLVLLILYDFLSQFTKANILGKLLALILSVVLIYVYLFSTKVEETFETITTTTTKIDVMDIIVLSKDTATKLEDAKDYTFGFNSNVNGSITANAISDINKQLDTVIDTTTYYEWKKMIDDLYNNTETKAIIINDSLISTLDQEFENFSEKTKIIGSVTITTKLELSESDKKVNEEPFVIYLSGNDQEGNTVEANGLSDVNILVIANPLTRQILLISTPRDSYINITTADGRTGLDKLTHAGISGIDYSMKALENMYGINIDYFVKLNFTGCEEIVNALGGITVESDVDFINGFEAAGAAYHFKQGPNRLNGQMTLAFCRERKAFGDGDFQRGRNQQAAIKGIINKATSPAILAKYNELFNSVVGYLITNMSGSTIGALVKAQLNDPTPWSMQSYAIEGTPAWKPCPLSGYYNDLSVVLLDQNSIELGKSFIQKTINGETFNVEAITNPTHNSSQTDSNNNSGTNESTSATSKSDSSTEAPWASVVPLDPATASYKY